MNKPNPSRLTQQEWKYEPLEVMGRTGRLLALGLLDKSGKEVSEMLRTVEVVQDDMGWDCKSWTFGAIDHLRDQGIIRAMPLSLDDLYDVGSQIARNFATTSPENVTVPTFNSAGEVIKSEIK